MKCFSHNRQNAARLAGVKSIPTIVKAGLKEEEAYVCLAKNFS